MKINCIYFSPTGSTEKVVQLIADAWNGEKLKVDVSVPGQNYADYSFGTDELCVIGVPSFGGRVPAVAKERLQQMKADQTPTVLVATFGNRDYDDTLLELQDCVGSKGFHVVAAIAAVTEHSIMHQFATGRPDHNDCEQLLAYADKIKQTLEQGTNLSEVQVKGNIPYKEYNGVPFKPNTGKSCTQCGICAASCPVQAIPLQHPSETDKDCCISCMRCVALCPRQARKLNAAMLLVAGKKMQKSCAGRKANEFFLAGLAGEN